MLDIRRGLVALARVTRWVVVFFALPVGVVLAWHHPVLPWAATAAFLLWCVVVHCRPGLWLFIVPALLPLLNFAPWTGWVVVEEVDLLLLGVVCGGHAQQAFARAASCRPADKASYHAAPFAAAAIVFGLCSAVAGVRGFAAANDVPFSVFQGYVDPLSALRAVKSVGFAALLWPLLCSELNRDRPAALRHLAWGMVTGLAVVTLAVLWERLAYTGLWDFSTPYRTTALFWEMHVGGAAIDAYLALATPFVAWALWTVRTPWRWAGVALLALLTGYVCLTTFSRGVYGAVGGSLLLLAVCLRWRRMPHLRVRWRTAASALLLLVLVLEVAAVLGLGTFMRDRIGASDQDLGSRRQHWQSGLGLLHSPVDWLLGIGAGRLPANFAREVPRREFPGETQFVAAAHPGAHGVVQVLGPKTRKDMDGLLALTQRVPLEPVPHQVVLTVRAPVPTDLSLSVCAMHLLYPRQCQSASLRVPPSGSQASQLLVNLTGPLLDAGSTWTPRLGVFSAAVLNPGGRIDIEQLSLVGPDGAELLSNGEFALGMAHWYPSAQRYYVPWHIDSLYLELLIERGVIALLAFLLCVGCALKVLLRRAADPMAPFIAASLCGGLSVGLISSVMDVPRVAFLMLLLTLFAVESMRVRPAA